MLKFSAVKNFKSGLNRSEIRLTQLSDSTEILTRPAPRYFEGSPPKTKDNPPNRPLGKRHRFIRRSARYVVVGMCAVFCTVLLGLKLMNYFAFPTIVNVKVEIMEDIMKILPGITVCTNNRITTKYLGKARKSAKRGLQEIEASNISDIEKYRAKADLFERELYEHFDSQELITHFNRKKTMARSTYFIPKLVCDQKTWVPQGQLSSNMRDACNNVYKARFVEKAGSCYTLFHKAGLINFDYWIRPSLKLDVQTRIDLWRKGMDMYFKESAETTMRMVTGNKGFAGFNFPKNGLLTMALEFNLNGPPGARPNMSTNLKEVLGGKLWVHSNRVIPWMSTKGFSIFPGKRYTVYIKKTTTKNMKAPYATKCRNYTGEYLKEQEKRGFGMDLATPMSQEACRDECIGSKFVEKQNCWPNVLPFRKENQTAANRTTVKWCPASQDINTIIGVYRRECDEICPTDCLVEDYSLILKESPNPDPMEIEFIKDTKGMEEVNNEFNIWQPTTIIDFVFSTVEETVHEHEASFPPLPFTVDAAGYFGLFFAMSALDLYDFIKLLVEYVMKRVQG